MKPGRSCTVLHIVVRDSASDAGVTDTHEEGHQMQPQTDLVSNVLTNCHQ